MDTHLIIKEIGELSKKATYAEVAKAYPVLSTVAAVSLIHIMVAVCFNSVFPTLFLK